MDFATDQSSLTPTRLTVHLAFMPIAAASQETERLRRINGQNDSRIRTLEDEVSGMKSSRAQLQRRMREDAKVPRPRKRDGR